jgi:hypothetical protein
MAGFQAPITGWFSAPADKNLAGFNTDMENRPLKTTSTAKP